MIKKDDAQPHRCSKCEAETFVMPSDLAYGQSVECQKCGQYDDVHQRELTEMILRWLACVEEA